MYVRCGLSGRRIYCNHKVGQMSFVSRFGCFSGLAKRAVLPLALLLLLCGLSSAWAVQDFTFLHVSDVHAPYAQSKSTIPEIATLGPIEMTPYASTSDAPSFVIVTGDLTEFGYRRGWQDYLSYWKDVKLPIYNESGNHDGTWDCLKSVIRSQYGAPYYSFDKFGCHFIGLDTATPQDPRPSVSVEQLIWLQKDLANVTPETPVFLFCHHPFGIGEFAGQYERDEVVDILRPYNVVAILMGHGHGWERMDAAGIDMVMGGSTATPEPGFSVVSIKNGMFRAAYKKKGDKEATLPILEKVIPEKAQYPTIRISGIQTGDTYRGANAVLRASISDDAGVIKGASYMLDDLVNGDMVSSPSSYTAVVDLTKLTPGAHYLRVVFESASGRKYQKSTMFYCESNGAKAVWRASGLGSFKGAPAVTRDAVYVGGTDGRLYAFRRSDGKALWTYDTGGEILCQPAVTEYGVCFGSGDGKVYSVGFDGKFQWSYQAARPVYSSPVAAGNMVIIGSNDSRLYALDSKAGSPVWVNADAGYTIEDKPFVQGDTVYFGAWDGHLYAVDLQTGKTRWRSKSQGVVVRKGNAESYYSPADCGPVVANGKVFAADRNYMLTIFDASDGKILDSMKTCSAVGLSEDGKYMYLRRNNGDLTKIDTDGKVIWNVSEAGGDAVPAAPTEQGGVVYVSSNTGRLRALSASDGSVKWEYQATPRLYVFGPVQVLDGIAYVSGMDGRLTAVSR